MGLREILRREFSFISGNYKILVVSWMIMDLAMEMPAPKAIKESVSVWKKVLPTAFWIFTIETLIMFGASLTNVINAVYARDVLGIAENQWWLVYIPLLLTMIIASLPVGKIVDKFGKKIRLSRA